MKRQIMTKTISIESSESMPPSEFARLLIAAEQELTAEGYTCALKLSASLDDDGVLSVETKVDGSRPATDAEQKNFDDEEYQRVLSIIDGSLLGGMIEVENAALVKLRESLNAALARPETDKNRKSHIKGVTTSIARREKFVRELERLVALYKPLRDLPRKDQLSAYEAISAADYQKFIDLRK